jgi:hypothetical protein
MPTSPDLTAARINERREKIRRPSDSEKPLIDAVQEKEEAETPRPVNTQNTYRPGMLVKPLTAFYETIGGLIILADPTCGQAIINSAEEAAKALDELARTNPKVRKVLMRLMQSGAVTKVVIAHLPIVMAVLAHHFPKALVYVGQMFSGTLGQPQE